ncbi:hypothetical protein BD94_2391 [Elizabethkingia anophelis NUHP1]|uniref:Uncharacterized protein n=1 Tax=Elizabethkingia anophelis NUHP1 TaxID=1338011 RepID=A0A077EEV5_9FLAO|nr:hypothetical protein BD94_2391 [Elizabethkingia anophelis NUHP1]
MNNSIKPGQFFKLFFVLIILYLVISTTQYPYIFINSFLKGF